MSTHNLCFEQKCEIYQNFLSENYQFLEVIFSIYLNRRVFVMCKIMRQEEHFMKSCKQMKYKLNTRLPVQCVSVIFLVVYLTIK